MRPNKRSSIMEIENLQSFIRFMLIFGVMETLLRLGMIWNVLSEDEGADRLCWVIVLLTLPLFGPAAYVCIWRAERERRGLESGSARL
jgi:hypothetical protein